MFSTFGEQCFTTGSFLCADKFQSIVPEPVDGLTTKVLIGIRIGRRHGPHVHRENVRGNEQQG